MSKEFKDLKIFKDSNLKEEVVALLGSKKLDLEKELLVSSLLEQELVTTAETKGCKLLLPKDLLTTAQISGTKEIQLSNIINLAGVKECELNFTKILLGNKEYSAMLIIDSEGTKEFNIDKIISVKGKRDIRNILLSLIDLDEED